MAQFKTPPPDALEMIKRMASTGFSKKGCAFNLGVDVATLNRWLEDYPELGDAFEMGREIEHNALFNALYSQAIYKGNATAAMFLLKSRHGYREGDQSEIANRVSISFILPGADKLEAVVKADKKPKVIDAEPASLPKIEAGFRSGPAALSADAMKVEDDE